MKKLLKTKKDVAIFIAIIVVFFLGVMLISNIISTNKELEGIKENARGEVEKMLISTGLATYTKDIEQNDIQTLSNGNLPENTTENQQNVGTVVAPKENWNIETVTAISVGNGETVPVPKDFYYVGGDLSTGVIISDNAEDQYDGKTDKTTWEYTTNLKGNQFVWIPCKEEEYRKCEVWNGTTQTPSKLSRTGWDKTTYTSELPQIRKYEGFYVARYEAGLAETIPEAQQPYNKEGIPQAKAGVMPWRFIDWTTSQKNAKNMYNTNSISSGLITGTQWDVMLKKIVEKTDLTEADLVDSTNWGNYEKDSIDDTNGLLTTGQSKQTEQYHIFDVAGNLWEWTDEISLYKVNNAQETNVQHIIIRGGAWDCGGDLIAACYRGGWNEPSAVWQDARISCGTLHQVALMRMPKILLSIAKLVK